MSISWWSCRCRRISDGGAEERTRLSSEACLDSSTYLASRRANCATEIARVAQANSPFVPVAPMKFPSLKTRDEILFLTRPMEANHKGMMAGMGWPAQKIRDLKEQQLMKSTKSLLVMQSMNCIESMTAKSNRSPEMLNTQCHEH